MSKELATHWIDFLDDLDEVSERWQEKYSFRAKDFPDTKHNRRLMWACMTEQLMVIEWDLAELPEVDNERT